MSSDLPSAPTPSGGTGFPPHPCVFSERLPLGILKQRQLQLSSLLLPPLSLNHH